jgi:hypothetical protein
MSAGPNNRIELFREAGGVSYRLDGESLRNGDPLEVWTTLGWVRGVFAWEGEPYLPYVNVQTADRKLEPHVIVTGSLCHRPQATRQVQH